MKTSSRIQLFFLIPGNLLALLMAGLGLRILPANRMGWFLFIAGLAYLIGGVIFLWPKDVLMVQKMKRAAAAETRERSFWMAIPGFVAALFAAPLEYLFLGDAERAGLVAQFAGLALVGLGLVLWAWAERTLIGRGARPVQAEAGSGLQMSGPYRAIRHPSDAGLLLLSMGVGIGLGSYLGCLATFLFLLPGLYCRMCLEEELLTEQYGDAYLRYAVRTKRLIPGIW